MSTEPHECFLEQLAFVAQLTDWLQQAARSGGLVLLLRTPACSGPLGKGALGRQLPCQMFRFLVSSGGSGSAVQRRGLCFVRLCCSRPCGPVQSGRVTLYLGVPLRWQFCSPSDFCRYLKPECARAVR